MLKLTFHTHLGEYGMHDSAESKKSNFSISNEILILSQITWVYPLILLKNVNTVPVSTIIRIHHKTTIAIFTVPCKDVLQCLY